MLSRVANCIYWMTRYIERAENIARFVEVNQNLALDTFDRHNATAASDQWAPIISTTGDADLFAERYGDVNGPSVLKFLIADASYPGSILSCVAAARENARSVRESISAPMFEEINRLYLYVKTAVGDPVTLAKPAKVLESVRRHSHTVHGLTNGTMSRGESFHFARLGRVLERADKTSRILDVKYYILLPQGAEDVGTPLDSIQWAALLRSASGLHMYRQDHGRIAPLNVARFLILDAEFPRSVRSCVTRAQESLHVITGTPMSSWTKRSERLLGHLRGDLDFIDFEHVLEAGLHEWIDDLQRQLNDVGTAIHDDFFALRDNGSGTPELIASAARAE